MAIVTMHSGLKLHEIEALSNGSFAPLFARLLAPLTHFGAHGKEVFVHGIQNTIWTHSASL